MGRRLSQLAIIAGVIAGLACDRAPAAPEPGGPESSGPVSGSGVYTTPPVRGLVREINGGPIAGALVRLAAQTGLTSVTQRTPAVVTDQAGIFAIPPAPELCGNNAAAWLEVSKADFWFATFVSIACTRVSNPPQVSLEVKGQRSMTAAIGAPVQFTLSNDDVNLIEAEDAYSCGPCKAIGLTVPPQGPVAIHAEWSGPDPVILWLEGECCLGEWGGVERLIEVMPSPGQTAVTLDIPVAWRRFYLRLKVGLPYGGRFPAGAPPISVRIEVKT